MISNGIDIVKIDRFDKYKNDLNLMKKLFNESELDYIKNANNSSETIAGLYAAKESFLKALKKGINDYSLLDIEISHNSDRAPFIILHNELKKTYPNIHENMSLSISHDGEYAIAICTLFI